MKRYTGLLFVVLVMLFCSGCQLTTKEATTSYQHLQDVYINTVQILTNHKANGDIEQKDWDQKIFPLIEDANTLLDELKAAIKNRTNPDVVVFKLEDVLQKLIVISDSY